MKPFELLFPAHFRPSTNTVAPVYNSLAYSARHETTRWLIKESENVLHLTNPYVLNDCMANLLRTASHTSAAQI